MKYFKYFILLILFLSIAGISFYLIYDTQIKNNQSGKVNKLAFNQPNNESEEEKEHAENEKGRVEYFIRMLMDPKTKQVPPGIRHKELAFAKILSQKNISLKKTTQQFSWQEVGPNDVGGRTRALAVDVTNANIIIAGGVSGGIWKSTDNGVSWKLKNSSSTILNVTSIAQDQRPGFSNVWYYSTGEYEGNSARDLGARAYFTGDGVYKSTDSGETWSVLPSTLSKDFTKWDSQFDYTSKIIVSPTSGSIFIASNAFGIYRSSDGGTSFTLVLGKLNEHIYSDVDAAKNGALIAVISSPFQGYTPANAPGIYKSDDDGLTWTNITPNSFPTDFNRSVVKFAPSNSDIAYVFTNTAQVNNGKEVNKFYKINISNGTADDRSNNLPDFGLNDNDFVSTQDGYDMVIGVKPDDENLVLIGASSLFRSFDGFATKPSDSKLSWIGGYYHGDPFRYPNLHPDIHSFAFDPADPNKMWCGNDGGLSYTTDITNTNYDKFLPWVSKNHGYNVTQFYMVTFPAQANDERIMGGTQDNGTPFFTWDGSTSSTSQDLSSGDGAYAYFGNQFAYTSYYRGNVFRLSYDNAGNPSFSQKWSAIKPTGSSNQLFVNPFVVDPVDENIMYYPAGDILYRNTQLANIPDFQQDGTSVGWEKLINLTLPQGYGISALGISTNPAHILYYGASSLDGVPKLFKLNNANTATDGAVEFDIPNAPAGAYIHNIAVNPDNADEIMVVLSNYNIIGLYYSTDGGQTLTAVEGNLEGNDQTPGPSLRAATILPTGNGTLYTLATSIGIFSTNQLNGSNTNWLQESQNEVGNVVVDYITSRKSDNEILAGTHGRGAFLGKVFAGNVAQLSLNTRQLNIQVQPNQTDSVPLTISNVGNVDLNYSISITQPSLLISNQNKQTGKPKGERSILFPPDHQYWGLRAGLKQNKYKLVSHLINQAKTSSDDTLFNDDGNLVPDDYYGNNGTFYWLNILTPQNDFTLDKVLFYMRTESVNQNPLYLSISEVDSGQLSKPIYESQLTGDLAANGSWFEYQLPQPINFKKNTNIAVTLGSMSSIPYPAGFDNNGSNPGNAYYYEASSNTWINLQDKGFKNSAWLTRLVGTQGGGPLADKLSVNPVTGTISSGSSENVQVYFNAQNLSNGNYTGQLQISSNGGNATVDVSINVSNSVGVQQNQANKNIPDTYKISQNFPNPFNPSTVINYSVPFESHVTISIYNITGEKVGELFNGDENPGNYNVTFNAKNLASGVYIYSIDAIALDNKGRFSAAKKMIYLK